MTSPEHQRQKKPALSRELRSLQGSLNFRRVGIQPRVFRANEQGISTASVVYTRLEKRATPPLRFIMSTFLTHEEEKLYKHLCRYLDGVLCNLLV